MIRRAGPTRALALATAAMVLLLTLAIGVSLLLGQRALDRYEEATRAAGVAGTVSELRANLWERSAAVQSYVIRQNAEDLARVEELRGDFNGTADELASNGRLGPRDAAALDRLVAASEERYRQVRNRVVPAVGTPRLDDALEGYAAANSTVSRQADALAESIGETVQVSRAEAEHQSSRARTLGLLAGLLAALAAIALAIYAVRLFNRLIASIVSTIDGLRAAAGDMRSASAQTATATAEQSAAIAEVSAAAEELSATATVITENARTGATAAERTGETMQTMQEQVGGIAERSLRLGDRTQRIGEVVLLIEDIAEQTNLLALNAAIEAARAGDAGRGFAVVAGEVRKLAERSLTSTESINEIVRAVQDESNATIMATEQATKQAIEVSELMESTLDALADSIRATDQQRDAAGQVSATMADIRSAVQELASEQEQRAGTAQRVEEMIATLTDTLTEHGVSVNGTSAARRRG